MSSDITFQILYTLSHVGSEVLTAVTAINQEKQEASYLSLAPASAGFLLVHPKRRALSELHGVTTHKTVLFI
jgi:hypothetical protein